MRLVLLPFALALVCLVPACGPSQQCAIDTDCELGFYCSLAGSCLARGTSGDTDGGPRLDGAIADSGPPTDAPRPDAPADAPLDAALSCPAVAGLYTIDSVGVECTGVTASSITLTASPTECAFEVALDRGGSVGVVAQTGRESFSGVLSVLGTPGECTIAFEASLATATITCDRCIFSVTAP